MERAPAAKAPEHLRWDVADSRTHDASLVRAQATADEVVLHFGARQALGEGEVAAQGLASIALSPLTAKNLAATLRRLIDDSDGGAR